MCPEDAADPVPPPPIPLGHRAGGIQGGPPPCAGGPGTRRFLAYLCLLSLREKVGRGAGRSARSGECRGGTPRIVGGWDCRPAKNSPGCRAERLHREVLGLPAPHKSPPGAGRSACIGRCWGPRPRKTPPGRQREKRGPQGLPPPHQKNLLPFAAKYSIINGHDNKNAREGGRAVPQGRTCF